MKYWAVLTTVAAFALASAFPARATSQTTLTELLVNADGSLTDQFPTTSNPITSPVTVTSGFGASGLADYLSGLGTLQYTVTSAGTHQFIAFVDDEANYKNGWVLDHSAASGAFTAPGAPFSGTGVFGPSSWEIGNPSATGSGSIGDNTVNSTPGHDLLDDRDDILGRTTDVSFALGFDFTLAPGQVATIDLTLSSAPVSDFYLQDWNDGMFVDYSGSVTITSDVPDDEPTWFAMGLALMGLLAVKRFERPFCQKKS
jgi:hypothetical protein